MKTLLITLGMICISLPLQAGQEDKEYRPGGTQWVKVWQEFYNNPVCEGDLMNPLVNADKAMMPVILEAISHRDMKLRRYAIGALGWLKDRKALPALEKILKDETEINYFLGDALHSIFLIDRSLGIKYAKEFKMKDDYLKTIGEAIEKNEAWLTTYPEC